MPWMEPGPTPAGLMEIKGMSPRPTKAPGPDGIPHELLKRANSIVFSPTPYLCGFFSSGYTSELNIHTFSMLPYLTPCG